MQLNQCDKIFTSKGSFQSKEAAPQLISLTKIVISIYLLKFKVLNDS